MSDQVRDAYRALEEARKKLTASPGAEKAYAAAYERLCALQPAVSRPLRRKYR